MLAADTKKALGCFVDDSRECFECEYGWWHPYPKCHKEAAKDALALINGYEIEIQALHGQINSLKEMLK